MKHLTIFAFIVFQATTAIAGVGSAYLSQEVVKNRDDVVGFGREYSLGAAKDSAKHAAAVAGATGIALTSAGVGYLLAGNYSLGATLIGMGSIEFAQMGATAKAGQENEGLESVLLGGTNGVSPNYEGGRTESSKPELELEPQLESYLRNKGLNPAHFKNLLFSGELSDPRSALSALGENPSKYSDKVLEKAQKEAMKEFSKLSLELPNPANSAGGGGLGLDPALGNEVTGPQALTKINPETKDKKEEGREGKNAKGSKNILDFESAGLPPNFFPNLFGLPPESFSLEDQRLLFNAYLRDQGILNLVGMNIFQMAHQSYRGFAKGRLTKK